jgi:3'-phosphoadenosine 5'-phosphosulfate sulfotransferase (PAPS reductase)/FAD synthetase
VQLSIFPEARRDRLDVPPVIARALDAGAVVAASISGGKDSQAFTNKLTELGLSNFVFALHMDLGRAEWKETPGHVERIARENGLPLVVTRRPQGDLVQEIEERMEKLTGTGKPFWPSSASRYCTADQKRGPADKVYRDVEAAVSATPFWPSSMNRYCTSHHKSNQADKAYRQHDLIISAEGNRAEESTKRRKDPVVSVRAQITAKPLRDLPVDEALDTWLAVTGLLDAGDDTVVAKQFPEFKYYIGKDRPRLAITWYAIHDWLLEDVWRACGTNGFDVGQRRAVYQFAIELEDGGGDTAVVEALKQLALKDWPAHPAYVYGNERLSCALCILANDNDLRNGARHQPELAAHFIHLEEVGGSTFKNGRSLVEIVGGVL